MNESISPNSWLILQLLTYKGAYGNVFLKHVTCLKLDKSKRPMQGVWA